MLQLSLLPQSATKIIRLKSFQGAEWYNISTEDKTCDCSEFEQAGRCEHLSALGIHRLRPFKPATHPTFSQALSGLVKSLRVRRVEDAVYWLTYLAQLQRQAASVQDSTTAADRVGRRWPFSPGDGEGEGELLQDQQAGQRAFALGRRSRQDL